MSAREVHGGLTKGAIRAAKQDALLDAAREYGARYASLHNVENALANLASAAVAFAKAEREADRPASGMRLSKCALDALKRIAPGVDVREFRTATIEALLAKGLIAPCSAAGDMERTAIGDQLLREIAR